MCLLGKMWAWGAWKKWEGGRWEYGSNAQQSGSTGNAYLGVISLLDTVKELKGLWYPKKSTNLEKKLAMTFLSIDWRQRDNEMAENQ